MKRKRCDEGTRPFLYLVSLGKKKGGGGKDREVLKKGEREGGRRHAKRSVLGLSIWEKGTTLHWGEFG